MSLYHPRVLHCPRFRPISAYRIVITSNAVSKTPDTARYDIVTRHDDSSRKLTKTRMFQRHFLYTFHPIKMHSLAIRLAVPTVPQNLHSLRETFIKQSLPYHQSTTVQPNPIQTPPPPIPSATARSCATTARLSRRRPTGLHTPRPLCRALGDRSPSRASGPPRRHPALQNRYYKFYPFYPPEHMHFRPMSSPYPTPLCPTDPSFASACLPQLALPCPIVRSCTACVRLTAPMLPTADKRPDFPRMKQLSVPSCAFLCGLCLRTHLPSD